MPKVAGWNDLVGVRHKPETCRSCPFAAKGQGFCNDLVPDNPRIAFVFDTVTKDDIVDQTMLSGAQGYSWKKFLIEELGYKLSDVLVSAAIRCFPGNDKYGKVAYPTSWLGRQAELNCRRYDQAIIDFDPNIFVLTLHPRTINVVGAHRPQIQRDVQKAFTFASKGYRPCVLFGEGACELYFPYMKNNGGVKNWRGHFWYGESPFKDKELNEKKLNKKRFVTG